MKQTIEEFMDIVKQRNGHEPEFLQAVQEVAETVIPYIVQHNIYYGKIPFGSSINLRTQVDTDAVQHSHSHQ